MAKFIPVKGIRVNPDGSVQVKASGAAARQLAQAVGATVAPNSRRRRNIAAGAWGGDGRFHPFRSSPDYDPDRAGDEYGAVTDNKGFTRRGKKRAPKKRAVSKSKAKSTKTKKRKR